MTNPGWLIVVEHGEQWTAALRAALRRSGDPVPPRVARLDEAPALRGLDQQASVFVALAIRRNAASAALGWLDQTRDMPAVSAAALIPSDEFPADDDRRQLSLAAMQAGACLAVDSRRRLRPLVSAARRRLDLQELEIRRRLSPAQLAWRRLPWQSEPWRLG